MHTNVRPSKVYHKQVCTTFRDISVTWNMPHTTCSVQQYDYAHKFMSYRLRSKHNDDSNQTDVPCRQEHAAHCHYIGSSTATSKHRLMYVCVYWYVYQVYAGASCLMQIRKQLSRSFVTVTVGRQHSLMCRENLGVSELTFFEESPDNNTDLPQSHIARPSVGAASSSYCHRHGTYKKCIEKCITQLLAHKSPVFSCIFSVISNLLNGPSS